MKFRNIRKRNTYHIEVFLDRLRLLFMLAHSCEVTFVVAVRITSAIAIGLLIHPCRPVIVGAWVIASTIAVVLVHWRLGTAVARAIAIIL